MIWIPTAAFVAVMVLAMLWDVRTHRIPNRLTLAGLILGLAVQATLGWAALGAGLLGGAIGLLFGMALFAMGGMGGGDAKLFAVVGAFMGPMGFLLALVATALVGGVLAVGVSLRRGVLLAVLLNTKDALIRALTLGRRGSAMTLDSPGAVTIPYGAAIALGSIAAWFTLLNGGPLS
jgi:prepilin peptidase CpaA